MNGLLKGLKEKENVTRTENGAVTYKSTLNKVYDLFATGASMRGANESTCMNLFKEAYEESPTMALKCLFYLRDVRGGQGERRFFRLAMKWLASKYPQEAKRMIPLVSIYGRYDDLYVFVDTSCEKQMFGYLKILVDTDADHLVYKWLKSENCSSRDSKLLARRTREAFGMTPREYRKMLTEGRKNCHLVETLMSQNRWNEIEFQKLPSRAGMLYRNAFARREETKERYEEFMRNEKTAVHAGTLYPYDVVHAVGELWSHSWHGRDIVVDVNDVHRLAINKYWDNLTDYFNGASLNALVVCDTSGSMLSGFNSKIAPIDVAISLALYTAERANGPFHNHFISFSSTPKLIETRGVDFCDKVTRIYNQNLCENTNIEATFDLILNTAKAAKLSQDELPEHLVIVSDMQFDMARGAYSYWGHSEADDTKTLMEKIRGKWRLAGYQMPKLVFWNVNANVGGGSIPMKDEDGITFVSGASPVIFEQIMKGKTAQDLMYDKLLSDRYKAITSVYGNKIPAHYDWE